MGRWQPYLYNSQRTSLYDVPDVFNPKAVTMASHQPPPPKKSKPDGPLVSINRHPDSYLVLPYGKTDAKPMSPKTKVLVKVARWIQLFFRVLTLFGAIGVLLCAIFIRGAGNTEGYIIRIPPGVDMVNSLYAIYHLLRAAKARPAGSSASYHFFALCMDGGFIPLYVFTTLLAKRNYDNPAGTSGRWRTFFPTDEDADKVLLTAWLTATTVGGLHIASLILDLYLVLVFRKISKLPPDMNPLEENLTSRRKAKHKHKNSSISTISLTGEGKRFSTQSGTTTLIGDRNSQADPLISEKGITAPDEKKMAFLHTRTNSTMTYSPHTPNSARHSRSLYSQPPSAAQSRVDLHRRDDLHRREDDSDNQTLAERKSFLAQQSIKRGSRPNSMVSSKQDFYTPPTTADNQRATGDISQENLQSDNWFVHDGSNDELEEPATVKRQNLPRKPPVASMFATKSGQGYTAISPYDDVSDEEFDPPMVPQPLRMNPPTPPPTNPNFPAMDSQNGADTTQAKPTPPPLKRTLTVTTLSSEKTFSRSPSRASSPKVRYYGDLKAATSGIRNGGKSATQSPVTSPIKNSTPNNLPSSTKAYTSNAPMVPKAMVGAPFSLDKSKFASVRRTGEAGHTPVKAESPRVISRSGVDYDGGYFDDDSDLGTPGRTRDVSGKIAEEGRGGYTPVGRWGLRTNELTHRKVSGVA